jgi:predicted RNase H-like HicB family nuclease
MNNSASKVLKLTIVSFAMATALTVNARPFEQARSADHDPLIARAAAGGDRFFSLFSRIDTDSDGQLSLDEVTSARLLRSAHRFERLDGDGDGQVSLEEYLAATANRQDIFTEYGEALFACVEEALGEELPDPDSIKTPEERFAELDVNADGLVNQQELDQVLTVRVAEKFTETDLDGDGYLSEEEFQAGAEARINLRKAVRNCIDQLTEEGEILEDLTSSRDIKSVSPL